MSLISATDFWQYAYSDFFDNRNRGALAEFIVAKALGISKPPITSWEAYDLETDDGIKVEIKASGYVQSWHWNGEKTRPVYSIRTKLGWKGDTSEWDNEKKRHADVYVFCLHLAEKKEGASPLNINEWEFYVVPTCNLPGQASISLSVLRQITQPISFSGLSNAVRKASQIKNVSSEPMSSKQ